MNAFSLQWCTIVLLCTPVQSSFITGLMQQLPQQSCATCTVAAIAAQANRGSRSPAAQPPHHQKVNVALTADKRPHSSSPVQCSVNAPVLASSFRSPRSVLVSTSAPGKEQAKNTTITFSDSWEDICYFSVFVEGDNLAATQ